MGSAQVKKARSNYSMKLHLPPPKSAMTLYYSTPEAALDWHSEWREHAAPFVVSLDSSVVAMSDPSIRNAPQRWNEKATNLLGFCFRQFPGTEYVKFKWAPRANFSKCFFLTPGSPGSRNDFCVTAID